MTENDAKELRRLIEDHSEEFAKHREESRTSPLADDSSLRSARMSLDEKIDALVSPDAGILGAEAASPVAKVGYLRGHHEDGLQADILDMGRVFDGMLLYAKR